MSFTKNYRGALLSAGYMGHGKQTSRPLNYDFLKELAHRVRVGDLVDVVHEVEQEISNAKNNESEGLDHVDDPELEVLRGWIKQLSGRVLHSEKECTSSALSANEGVYRRKNKGKKYAFTIYRPHLEDDSVKSIEVTDTGVKRLLFAFVLNREARRVNEIYLSELDTVRKSIILCAKETRKHGQRVDGGESTRDLEGLDLSGLTPKHSYNDLTRLVSQSSRKSGEASDDSVDINKENTDNTTDHDVPESAESAGSAGSGTQKHSMSFATPRDSPSQPFQSSYGFSSDEEGQPAIVGTSQAHRQSTSPRRRSTKSRPRRMSLENSLFEVAVAPRTMYSILSNKNMDKERKDITMASLKNALQVAYHRVSELKALRILNHTAMIKILKKWDKVNVGKDKRDVQLNMPYSAPVERAYPNLMPEYELFTKGYEKSLRREICRIYATLFCGGDIEEAKGKLALAKGEVPKGQHDFSIGLILGVLLSVVTFMLYDLATSSLLELQMMSIDASMYIIITVIGMLLYKWMWHLHVHFWSAAGVNFRSLLMLPMKLLPDPMKAVKKILIKTLIVAVCILAFVLSVHADVPAITYRVWSILLWSLAMSYAVYNYLTEDDVQGVFDVSTIVNCLSPLGQNSAKDRFAMDVATSLTMVFLSLVYSSCLMFNGIIVKSEVTMENMDVCDPSVNTSVRVFSYLLTVFPFLIRLCQCMRRHYDSGSREIFMWPHGVNSCKYTLSIIVVSLGFFFRINISSKTLHIVVYVVICILSTALASYFDIFGDWGLAEIPLIPSDGADCRLSFWRRGALLRQDLMYPRKELYYVVMVINPLIRSMWTVSIVNVGEVSERGLRIFALFSFTLEILRRFLWGLLKMEYDHITASSKYEEALLHKKSASGDNGDATRRILNIHFETDVYDSTPTGEKNIAIPLILLCILSLIACGVMLLVGLSG